MKLTDVFDVEAGLSVHGARRAHARRALVRQLERVEAFGQDRAHGLEVKSRTEERELARLLRREIVRAGPHGGYWLDRERYADWRRLNLIVAVGAILVSAGLVACALLYAPRH